jgi:hypothetical protein
MFEQAGCEWCEAFDREIAPIYAKTEEGLRAPLRRVDTSRPLPPDLAFVETERLTPPFVLIDRDREIGRIRGYPGEEHFWGLLGVLLKSLTPPIRAETACNDSINHFLQTTERDARFKQTGLHNHGIAASGNSQSRARAGAHVRQCQTYEQFSISSRAREPAYHPVHSRGRREIGERVGARA